MLYGPPAETIVGALLIVRVAASEKTVLQPLLNLARYCLPSSLAVAVNVRVLEVAPVMSVKIEPFVLTCHCTAELPLADAVKLTLLPAHTV